ncbi:MAG: TonB-dependent receptor plug domain-containing protein [Betaproteobacteria bacterium]
MPHIPRNGRVAAVLLLGYALAASGRACAADGAEITAPPATIRSNYWRDRDADSAANPYRVAPSSRAATQTFTQEEIAALKPRDVFDLLNQATGVYTMYQGRKMPFSVRIRGDVNFAYIIDGVYLPESSAGRVLQSLPVLAIEQIDVVRDATALTLAPLVNFVSPSGAPNDGFIIIRTRRPQRNEATVRVATESFGTRTGAAFGGLANDKAYVSGLISNYRTDGPADQNMARISDTMMAKAGLHVGGLDTHFSYYRDRTNQQIQAADPAESTLWPQRWALAPIETSFGAGSASMEWNARHTTYASIAQSRVIATLLQGSILVPQPNFIANQEFIETYDIKHTYRMDATLLRAGAQYLHFNTPTGQSFYEGSPREERITAYYAYGEQGFFGRRLVVDASVRRDDQYVIQGVDRFTPTPGQGVLEVVRDRSLPSSNYWAAGAYVVPSPHWRLSGRVYHAEQGGIVNVLAVDNKPLDPEIQTKYEAGITYGGSPRFTLTATAFYGAIRNAKAPTRYVRSGARFVALYDQMNVVRSGVELSGNGVLESRLGTTRWRFGYTYLGSGGGALDYGREAPRNLFNGAVQQVWGHWDANIAVNRVDTFLSNFQSLDGQFKPIGDYTRVDLSVGRQFKFGPTNTRMALYGRNVTDRRYESQLGFRDPGRVIGFEIVIEL